MQTIQFETRNTKLSGAALKKAGKILAVFYGPKEKSTPITLKEIEFKKLWKEAGESSIVVLKNAGEEHEALIQDVDLHPVSGAIRHADFYVVEKGKKLKVAIPLEFSGVSPAVKDLGGILVKVLREITIEALPKDLPHKIEVDISKLATLDAKILAGSLALPAGVTIVTHADEVVAAIAVAKEEVEEVTKTLEDIEVVGQKGKEPVPGEEGAAAAGAKAPAADKKAPEKKAPEKK